MEEQEYIEVPVSWFESLAKYKNNVKSGAINEDIASSLNFLLGYLSSVDVILKYNNRVKK